jgi:protein-S-isoprenylcysteine O-methyltransferase Ste14
MYGFALTIYLLSALCSCSQGSRCCRKPGTLYHTQRRHDLAEAGPYRYVRRPQYIGFVAIMFGLLLQWPTLLTLVMFPVLVLMYVRLAIAEERDSEKAFGDRRAWPRSACGLQCFPPLCSAAP